MIRGWRLTGIGSYKQYIVSPERYTSLIPDGVSDYVAGPIMCSASTAYASIKDSRLRPGQWACFPGGGGGVGIQGVQLAVAMGLRVIVVDTGAERNAMCKKYGAEHFIDFKEVADTPAEVVKLTDGGAHAVYVTGTSQLLGSCYQWLADHCLAVQSYPQSLGYLGGRVGGQVMW
jgi:propanol-preferring alcohol dehydrogenase